MLGEIDFFALEVANTSLKAKIMNVRIEKIGCIYLLRIIAPLNERFLDFLEKAPSQITDTTQGLTLDYKILQT